MSEERTLDLRRAERRNVGDLRVDMQPGQTGTLVDLSEYGALLDLPSPSHVNTQVAFDLHYGNMPVRLHGRIVRCTPRYDEHARLEWLEPVSYRVAVEFFDLAAQSATTLRDLLRSAANKPAK